MKKMILKQTIIVMFCFLIKITNAQPTIEWQKCFGGSSGDEAYSIQQTFDGGFIVAGSTWSNDGNVIGNHDTAGSYSDIWILKISELGQFQWQKCFGGSKNDVASSIIQTSDKGFIIAGWTYSNDGDVSGNHDTTGFYSDYWIIKIDSIGALKWQRCYGGSKTDKATSIIQKSDGGYIVAGYTASNNGDVSGNHGLSNDFWVISLDTTGAIEWQKCLGGSQSEIAESLRQTNDGGYIICGYTSSVDGDVNGMHGGWDYWVVKLSNSGNLQWQKCLGGNDDDMANSIEQTSDNGYIVTGRTSSNDGDVSGYHYQIDCWIVKLNDAGNIEWQKCLGGDNNDICVSIHQTKDGGYIAAGSTSSNNGDVIGNHGIEDFWLVKLNSFGYFQWQKCIGGSNVDYASTIQITSDDGFIIAGNTYSNDGDVSGNHDKTGNNPDYWIVKLSPESGITETNLFIPFIIYPNPANDNFTLDFPEKSTIEILNLEGQIMKRLNTTEKQTIIDISAFARGMYFIKVTTDKGVMTKKFIKE